MNDTTLYTKILGIEKPWIITDIKLDLDNEEVSVFIKYDSKTGHCPTCNKECSIHDNTNSRKWRHLDTCQMKTYLVGCLPRIKCSEHKVQTILTPWAESHSHFTMLFEEFAIKLLQATKNQTKAANILRINFNQVHLIMTKAVKRGLSRRKKMDVEYIGIDEKSMKKGHNYLTVVSDLKSGIIIDVAKDRTSESTNEFLEKLKKVHNFLPLKAVSMDMWKPFMNEVNAVFPYADIVHDKFHIMKYLNEGIDKTRIIENKEFDKELKKELNKEIKNPLKKSKYLFLKNEVNMTDKQLVRFKEIKELTLKTCQAWRIKENFKGFFKCTFLNEAKSYLSQWIVDVKESKLQSMIKVSDMIKNHSLGLLNYVKHKISNGIAENLNGQIQQLKTVGRGFYSFENYRNAILFYLGKLDMVPHKTV